MVKGEKKRRQRGKNELKGRGMIKVEEQKDRF